MKYVSPSLDGKKLWANFFKVEALDIEMTLSFI
jgi:hypothetical protein